MKKNKRVKVQPKPKKPKPGTGTVIFKVDGTRISSHALLNLEPQQIVALGRTMQETAIKIGVDCLGGMVNHILKHGAKKPEKK